MRKIFPIILSVLILTLLLNSCMLSPTSPESSDIDSSTVTHEPDIEFLPWNTKADKNVLYTLDRIIYRCAMEEQYKEDTEEYQNYLIIIVTIDNRNDADVVINEFDAYCDSHKVDTSSIFFEEFKNIEPIKSLSVAANTKVQGYEVFKLPKEYTNIEVTLTSSVSDTESKLSWDIINGK